MGEWMKRCCKCRRWLPKDDFYVCNNRRKSADMRQPMCKTCQKEYVRDYKRRKREEARTA